MMSSVICRRVVETSTLLTSSKRCSIFSRIRARNIHVNAGGEKLQDWVNSPFLIATFGPRVALGALLTAPERISQLPADLSKVGELLTGSQPATEKANILFEEVEIRVTECLERGASVETDVYQNLRSLLPNQIQQNLPEEIPFIPTSTVQAKTTVEPAQVSSEDITYTSESVTVEKAASEVTGLSDAIIAVRTAQSTLKTNNSQAREKMLKMNLQEERDILKTVLTEISTGGAEVTELINDAKTLLAETENQI